MKKLAVILFALMGFGLSEANANDFEIKETCAGWKALYRNNKPVVPYEFHDIKPIENGWYFSTGGCDFYTDREGRLLYTPNCFESGFKEDSIDNCLEID